MADRYHHAYSFSFEVATTLEDASDVPAAQLRAALLYRIGRLNDNELLDACEPYDTFREEEPDDA